jgi:hypothetical protein
VWRPILAGVLTFSEVENNCDLLDLLDANDALDFQLRLEKEAHERSRR